MARQASINGNRNVWYWNEKEKTLCARTDPFKKSHAVKMLITRYLPTGFGGGKKAAATKRFIEKGRSLKQTRNPQPGDFGPLGIFKRTAEAAGTVVALGKQVVADQQRWRNWSIESVMDLAYEELRNALRLDKCSDFLKHIKNKVDRTSSTHGHHNRVQTYCSLVNRYRKTPKFMSFALSLVNYFGAFLELQNLLQADKSKNASKNPAKEEQQKKDIQQKIDAFETQLGNKYASLVLGIDELNDIFHHMDCGKRRLYSFTVTDQLLHELILEYAGTIVFLVFRSDNVVQQSTIKIELGKILRTSHFNPYEHAAVQKRLEVIQNPGVVKRPIPMFARKMSMHFKKDALGDVLTRSQQAKPEPPPKEESDSDSDASDASTVVEKAVTRGATNTRGSMFERHVTKVPVNMRAAAERRIRGARPPIAQVIHQKSSIITQALKETIDVDVAKKEFELNHNMYSLNKNRRKSGICPQLKRQILFGSRANGRLTVRPGNGPLCMKAEVTFLDQRHRQIAKSFGRPSGPGQAIAALVAAARASQNKRQSQAPRLTSGRKGMIGTDLDTNLNTMTTGLNIRESVKRRTQCRKPISELRYPNL